jgi:hypothetical protein
MEPLVSLPCSQHPSYTGTNSEQDQSKHTHRILFPYATAGKKIDYFNISSEEMKTESLGSGLEPRFAECDPNSFATVSTLFLDPDKGVNL